MLARHLLFLATRRPQHALLPFPADASPSPVPVQPPPPYVGPPQPKDWQKHQRHGEYIEEPRKNQKVVANDGCPPGDRRVYDNRACYGQGQQQQPQHTHHHHHYHQEGYADNRGDTRTLDNNQRFYEPPRYGDNRQMYARQVIQAHNAKNQQFCPRQRDVGQQFYTLPTRRPQREAEPPRSVTPDITRGLGRGPLSAMHMLARHGQKPVSDSSSGHSDGSVDLNRRNSDQVHGRCRIEENQRQQQQQPPADVRNRFVAPLSLSALGYRFFASSPVHETERKTSDILRHPTMSPIGTGNAAGGFKSSTPTARSNPTVAERLTMVGNNCPSPVPGSSGRSTPSQTSSGRNTPTNLVLSPTKSTMSNEELFAAIHKSKRRLNIKDDAESLSPASSTSSLVKAQAGTRHSWSPESQKAPEIPPTVQSPSATSRLDFKRLLLQQSVKTGPTRLSAAEQLKLSRQQCQQQLHQQQYHQQLPQNVPQVPLAKVLSPRSVWRFQTPRTDVLSSTIIEDAAAEEKAMKPSPENPPPSSRLNSRRQLDLFNDLPERLAQNAAHNEKVKNDGDSIASHGKIKNGIDRISSDNRLTSRTPCSTSLAQNLLSVQRVSVPYVQNIPNTPTSHNYQQQQQGQYGVPKNPAHNIPRSQTAPVSSYDNRRINNQLARAQFLAGVPADNDNQRQSAYFEKRFRARSESPQPSAAHSVARSPSAPTLETAL